MKKNQKYRILESLKKQSPQSKQGLSRSSGVRIGDVYKHLTRLKRDGMISEERLESTSGRVLRCDISITSAGKKLFSSLSEK